MQTQPSPTQIPKILLMSRATSRLRFCKHTESKPELIFLQNLYAKPNFSVLNVEKQMNLTQFQFSSGKRTQKGQNRLQFAKKKIYDMKAKIE